MLFLLEVCNYVFHFSKTRHIVCDVITLSVLLSVVSQGDLSYDIQCFDFAPEKDHVGVKWSFRQDDHFQNALVYCLHSIIIESSFQENRFQTRNLTKSNKKSVPSSRTFVVDSLSSRGSKGSMILDIIQSAAPGQNHFLFENILIFDINSYCQCYRHCAQEWVMDVSAQH